MARHGQLTYTFIGTAAALKAYLKNVIFNPTDRVEGVGETFTTSFSMSVFDGEQTSDYLDAVRVVTEIVERATGMRPTIEIVGDTVFSAVDKDGLEQSVVNPFTGVDIWDDNPMQFWLSRSRSILKQACSATSSIVMVSLLIRMSPSHLLKPTRSGAPPLPWMLTSRT